MPALQVDGSDVEALWNIAGQAVERARNGDGPTFILAHCSRLEGHFLGDPLLRSLRSRRPVDQMRELAGPLLSSFSATKGASLDERIASIGTIGYLIGRIATEQHWNRRDPIDQIQRKLRKADKVRLNEIEKEVGQEIQQAVEIAISSPQKHSLDWRNK